MVCQQDDLLPEQTIEGLSDELIEEEYKLLSKLAEGTTDDMNRPNPPIKPLHCRLEQKLTSEGYVSNEYTGDMIKYTIPSMKLPDVKAGLTNFGETGVIVDKFNNANDVGMANANFVKTIFHEEILNLPRRNKVPFGLIIASKGPQQNTLDEFWNVVLQNNVTKIISLCATGEANE